jgi:hypothetical protein
MNHSPNDAGIPMLTEIIDKPAQAPTAVPTTLSVAPPPETENVAKSLAWDDEKWEKAEREIRERVLQQILDRIDFVLEQRVRDSLADVLQTAVEGLATEIRSGLHNTMKDVVTRAVAQEISKLQSSKK